MAKIIAHIKIITCFSIILSIRYNFLILYHGLLGLDDLPSPLGHGIAQLLEVVLGHVLDPHLLHHLGESGHLLLLGLVLHEVLGIFVIG